MLHARSRVKLALFLILFTALGAFAKNEFRCHVCKLKVKRGYTVEGKFYCPDHLDTALPHCSNCQKGIQGKYRLIGPRSKPVCKQCRTSYSPCFLCSLPVDPAQGGTALSDGRNLCQEHSRNGIVSPATAKRIFTRGIQETVAVIGTVMRLQQKVRAVKLVDLHGLQAATDDDSHSSRLASGKVLGLTTLIIKSQGDRAWTEPATVHLLDNVPRERMLTVAIHEYTHAWHAENHSSYSKTSQELREGFSEWVAYKVSQAYGRDQQIKILMNPRGGVYYTGLKKFLALEQDRGMSGVIDFATSAHDI